MMMSSVSRFPIMCQIDGAGDGGGDAGANGGGTSGDGSGDGAGNAGGASAPDWGNFIGAIDKLNTNLGGKLDAVLGAAQSAQPSGEPDDSEGDDAPPPNFDEMTNAELVAFLSSNTNRTMKAIMSEALAPLIDRVNGLTTSFTQNSVNADVEKVRADNKDFGEWHDEMIDLAKENPTLNVKRLYALAKAENPAKAEKLAAKYAPPPKPKPNAFGGFTPAPNGKSAATPVVSALEASREAYREVAERHPGVLPNLSE